LHRHSGKAPAFRTDRSVGSIGTAALFIGLLLGCNAGGPGLRQVSTKSSHLAGSGEALACVELRPEVIYRNNGYDHIVHLRNRCDKAAVCSVATNVNPTPVEVTLAAGQKVAVLTFRGSPAREFTPNVTCRF
jgi:hypothetical protein